MITRNHSSFYFQDTKKRMRVVATKDRLVITSPYCSKSTTQKLIKTANKKIFKQMLYIRTKKHVFYHQTMGTNCFLQTVLYLKTQKYIQTNKHHEYLRKSQHLHDKID